MTQASRDRFLLSLAVLLGVTVPPALSAEPSDGSQWKPLFNGRTLDGWEVMEGEGEFFAEDGEIVGQTTPGAKGSYLCTKDNYDNFILEVEFKIDEGLNSGVQIRSGVHEEEAETLYLSGRLELVQKTCLPGHLFGYQIEIDTSPRAWTGGFYEQGRRGWLQTLEYNEPARKAFQQGQWNKFRIEAKHDSIKSWVNGVPATDTRDAWSRTGRIGLQLHSSKEPGKQVRWRNIRIQELD